MFEIGEDLIKRKKQAIQTKHLPQHQDRWKKNDKKDKIMELMIKLNKDREKKKKSNILQR